MLRVILSPRFDGHFPGLAGFIGAKVDGDFGDNWRYKTCIAPVRRSPLTNQNSAFYRLNDLPITQLAVSQYQTATKQQCSITEDKLWVITVYN